jgi:uncharacterized protein (UPF0333 family)
LVTSANTNNTYLTLNCAFGLTSNYPAELEENVSKTSACFISSLVNNKYKGSMAKFVGKIKSICYQYSCDSNNKVVNIHVGGNKAICPTNGGVTSIEGYSVILYCPDYNSICTFSKVCYSMVDCALKKIPPDENTNIYN